MSHYQKQVTDFFNKRNTYDTEGDSHPREAKLLLESVPLKPGQAILDLCTGTGLVAIPAAQKITSTGSVIGIDISSGMLAQAKKKIAVNQLDNIQLIEKDAEFLDFEPEQFDVIFCCSAITYISIIYYTIKHCNLLFKDFSRATEVF